MSLIHGGGGPRGKVVHGRFGRFARKVGRGIGRINPRTGRPMHRRGRGISAANLRGFRRIVHLMHELGMVPKKTGKHPIRRKT